MSDRSKLPKDPAITWRVDTELRMLADAVELVRSGASERVTLGGLRFGDQLLPRARSLAARAGVSAVGVYGTDESAGTDIVIERQAAPRTGSDTDAPSGTGR
jgi:hypothetical protein